MKIDRGERLGKVVRGALCLLLFWGWTTSARPGLRNPHATPPLAGIAEGAHVHLLEAYGNLPLSFEPNQGQVEARVRFLSRGAGYMLFLTANEAVLVLGKGTRESPQTRTPIVLRMKLVAANRSPHLEGLDELPGKSNYFIGNDPRKWRANVPNYAKVRYQGVYAGIGVVYYGNPRHLEHDFIVGPGADPSLIRLAVEGWAGVEQARPLELDGNGDLRLPVGGGEIRFHKPVVYQPAGVGLARFNVDAPRSAPPTGARHLVEGRYVLKGAHQVGFEIGPYDASRPLIIDPMLSYSTYLGGGGDEAANGVAVDGSGNAYLTGVTHSSNFPTAGALQGTKAGDADAFVSKLNATGTALIYSTYLGGNSLDKGTAIAVDSSGNTYVTGYTSSANFPTTTGVFQPSYGGNTDAFVAQLNATGSQLVYSSYLGGSDRDFGWGVAVDSSGNAYVTGSTASSSFPLTSGAFQPVYGGGSDAFVVKVNSAGTALAYSTYLGGSGPDSAQGIAVDAAGNAYVTGFTYSTDFPTRVPFQASNHGGFDAFVSKLNPAGTALVYSSYLGGSGQDQGLAIAVDSAGNAYVTGQTNSTGSTTGFPTTPGAFKTTLGGGFDAFVTKVDATGGSPLIRYSTYLGGTADDSGQGIAVDAAGNAYVTGFTYSTDFATPLVAPFQASNRGGSDAFVVKVNGAGSALLYSSYLGGSGLDAGLAIALDASGSTYVAGSTASTNFPPTVGALQTAYGGGSTDAFVAKISLPDAPAVALLPQQINFGDQGTGSTSSPQTVYLINAGSAPLTVTSVVSSSDFSQTSNCGTVAAGGTQCPISVTFSPTTTGNLTGTITITDSAAGSPHQVALSGNGVTPTPAVTLSPTSLTFPDETFGTRSPSQPVTLTNSGTGTLNISNIAAGGDFLQTNNCSSSLSPRASCTINVVFAPVGTGSRTGSLTITDDANPSSQTVSLTGNGLALFSLSSSTSSPIPIGTTSTTFTVTAVVPASFTDSIVLACTGGATCSFNPTSITRDQPTSTISVTGLSASAANPFSFTVTGTSGPQSASVALSIVFQDFSVSASPPLGLIVAGQAANYTVTVTPSNGFAQTVTLSCSFASVTPQGTTCSVSPSTLALSGSPATASVVLATTSRSRVRGRLRGAPPRWGACLGLLGLMVLVSSLLCPARLDPGQRAGLGVGSAQLHLARLGLVVAALLVLLGAGCGAGASINLTGTPPGNYVLNITGTITSPSTVTRSTTVNLSVG